eukprot:1400434-Amphidinium_carterae.1
MANADQSLRVMRGRGEEGELTQRDISNRWKRHRQRLENLKVKSPEWICAKCGASNFMQGPNTKTECRSCWKDGDTTADAKGWLLLNHYQISKLPAQPLHMLYSQLERLRPIEPSTSASSRAPPLMKPPPPLPSTPPNAQRMSTTAIVAHARQLARCFAFSTVTSPTMAAASVCVCTNADSASYRCYASNAECSLASTMDPAMFRSLPVPFTYQSRSATGHRCGDDRTSSGCATHATTSCSRLAPADSNTAFCAECTRWLRAAPLPLRGHPTTHFACFRACIYLHAGADEHSATQVRTGPCAEDSPRCGSFATSNGDDECIANAPECHQPPARVPQTKRTAPRGILETSPPCHTGQDKGNESVCYPPRATFCCQRHIEGGPGTRSPMPCSGATHQAGDFRTLFPRPLATHSHATG